MLKKLACGASALLFAASAYGTILPPNDLHLEDTILDSNIDEALFNDIIDQALEVYGPIIRDVHGANLSFSRQWTNNTVNASAQQTGRTWRVNMFGGLARRAEVTPDGFALVVCHELGHHLGGYPFTSSWAANEGQSDYFATQSCARELWRDELDINASFRVDVGEIEQTLCDSIWSLEADQDLCYRNMEAGKSLAALLGGPSVKISTPDTSKVRSTNNRHPAGQCRLDTYVAGALCDVKFDRELIPGKSLGRRRNSAAAESESADFTCSRANNYDVGVRSFCWFAPKL